MWKQSGEGLLRPKNQVKLLFESEVCRRLKIGRKYVFSLDQGQGIINDSAQNAAVGSETGSNMGGSRAASSVGSSKSKAVWQAAGPPLTHSSR